MPDNKPRANDDIRLDRQERAILDATWCYYHEGLNQNEIANKLDISRASVVNYLSEARKRGYIRISLDPNIFTEHELARTVANTFGLKEVSIAPSSNGSTAARVAKMAADWLPHLLTKGDRLGVAWGETIFQISESASRQTIEDLEIVQLVGSRPASKGFAAEICSAMLARQFGAHCVNLHVPLLLSDKNLVQQLLAEPVIVEQMAAVTNCNKTIFACGTCNEDSHILKTGLMDFALLEEYKKRGATGVICGRLIDAHGNHMPTDVEERMIGVTLDKMKDKEMSLLVGSGQKRVEPMLAAIRGGYATHLATCDETAMLLLKKANSEA
ncbi:sugar-binding transcriptional regulator [Ahrensia sp. 13_GOM-1096m]|uniref:sugar-binding transcriptional regulator n=1 Tax=Ahrensia sp. 13_GOM-1096m TaxID=1380380 RepID=UPI000479E07C|nr:sugar-binding transcriptional regulator [Ahrensia sp. 13_GOM-1096m]